MTFDPVTAVLLIPAGAAMLLAALPGYRLTARINVLAAFATLVVALSLFFDRPPQGPYFHVDDLNNVFIVLTTFVGFTTSVFSASYIGHELEIGRLTPVFLRFYHAMYQVLMFAMNLALVANNIGLMWVAIELATLTTVLMVGIYRTHEALEAAWKYFILGSVGIALALFGTILVYMAARPVMGEGRIRSGPAQSGVRFPLARLRHQSGARPPACLAARRPRRGADPDLGSAVRPSAQRRALCAAALQDAARGQSGSARARAAARDDGAHFAGIRRFHAVPAARHQAHVCLLLDRAHGHHRICIRHGWPARQFCRAAAHDHAFTHQVGDFLCSRSHRPGQGHSTDRRARRTEADQPGARLGIGDGGDCDCGRAAARNLHERVSGCELHVRARTVARHHSGLRFAGGLWRAVLAAQCRRVRRAAPPGGRE